MNDNIDGTILTPYIKGKLKLLPAESNVYYPRIC